MKELTKEEVLNFWKETKHKTNVYIHSAFCKEQCEYCTYKGTLYNKDAFKQYYSEYLPNLLEFYKDVLSSDIIYSYFFGGGTPSLMTPEIMRNVFDRIPNFKNCSRKMMEFHICDWNKEQLDILREYNFNTVIACVQSFDRDIVKQQKRRVPKNDEAHFEFIRYANSLGLYTMSDIIFFDTGDIDKDLDRLKEDMQKLADNDITEISVQTIHNIPETLGKFDVPVTTVIRKFLEKNTQYIVLERPFLDTNYFANSEGIKIGKECKVYKRGTNWDKMAFQLDALDGIQTKPDVIFSTNYNVLGIGSYKNYKHTFSKIEDKIEYIEDGDTYTPKWLLTYDKKEWSTKKMITNFYDELENTIGEPPDGIFFNFTTQVTQCNEDNRNKEVERRLIVSMNSYTTEGGDYPIIIKEYIEKHKNFYRKYERINIRG